MRGGGGMDNDERRTVDAVDPFFMALLRSRQRRFAECVDICTEILAVNPYDQVRVTTLHLVARRLSSDDGSRSLCDRQFLRCS